MAFKAETRADTHREDSRKGARCQPYTCQGATSIYKPAAHMHHRRKLDGAMHGALQGRMGGVTGGIAALSGS